jgi:TetR/AcrR family transcriptional regulator, cholesterol catabolism regulator
MAELLTERKSQIAAQATLLFKERGYAATSMRDLAAAIGIEAASLYSHVRSKEALLHRICFEMAEAFFEARDQVSSLQLPAPVKLRLAIEKHVEVVTRDVNASAVFLHEWRHLSEPDLSVFKSMRRAYEEYLTGILQAGHAAGQFHLPNEKLAVLSLLSSLNWLYDWYRPDGPLQPHQIAQLLADQVLNGLIKNN